MKGAGPAGVAVGVADGEGERALLRLPAVQRLVEQATAGAAQAAQRQVNMLQGRLATCQAALEAQVLETRALQAQVQLLQARAAVGSTPQQRQPSATSKGPGSGLGNLKDTGDGSAKSKGKGQGKGKGSAKGSGEGKGKAIGQSKGAETRDGIADTGIPMSRTEQRPGSTSRLGLVQDLGLENVHPQGGASPGSPGSSWDPVRSSTGLGHHPAASAGAPRPGSRGSAGAGPGAGRGACKPQLRAVSSSREALSSTSEGVWKGPSLPVAPLSPKAAKPTSARGTKPGDDKGVRGRQSHAAAVPSTAWSVESAAEGGYEGSAPRRAPTSQPGGSRALSAAAMHRARLTAQRLAR